jgi:hypothetical protein
MVSHPSRHALPPHSRQLRSVGGVLIAATPHGIYTSTGVIRGNTISGFGTGAFERGRPPMAHALLPS